MYPYLLFLLTRRTIVGEMIDNYFCLIAFPAVDIVVVDHLLVVTFVVCDIDEDDDVYQLLLMQPLIQDSTSCYQRDFGCHGLAVHEWKDSQGPQLAEGQDHDVKGLISCPQVHFVQSN